MNDSDGISPLEAEMIAGLTVYADALESGELII